MKKFEKKHVIITGASKGIGKSLVEYFEKEGAYVAAISRSQNEYVKNTGTIYIQSDICDLEKIKMKLEQTDFSADILINNAGVMCYEYLLDIKKDQIREVFDTNVCATLLLTQMIAAQMIKEKKEGVIINTLSFAATIPSAGSGIYAASKAALASLTRTMAAEWAPYGIRVNGYSPGVIKTQMTMPAIEKSGGEMVEAIALRQIGTAEQMQKIVAFLASEDSAYMTGVNIDASGGKFIVQNAGAAWKEAENG